jgi:RNA polymerase sigma-70 factor (ECF subfamily)
MSHLDPDTDELLRECDAGDIAARDRLFQRHRERLRRMVRVHLDERLARRLDPSDVVQETLAEAAVRLPDYLATRPIEFYPWLRQIAWERLVRIHERHIIAKKRSVDREAAWQPHFNDESVSELAARFAGNGSSPSVQAVRRELVDRLRQVLQELSEPDRQLIVLRYMEQLPFKDIAAVLGITLGTVKTRHFRAIGRLHDLLAGEQF